MERNKKIYYAIFIVLIVISGICYSFFTSHSKISEKFGIQDGTDEALTKDLIQETKKEIFVQLCGSVHKEAVYQVEEGTRIFEIVELAGGLTEDAASSAINQARIAQDGELIFFPSKEEVEQGKIAGGEDSFLIRINSASKEQLMTLPGIGEAKALSIIQYREENNGFKKIEEVMEVSGIKESIYEKMKDLITL